MRPTNCAACGKPLEQPVSGRSRRYCNDTCRKRHARRRESQTPIIGAAERVELLDVAKSAPAEEQLAATLEHEQIVILSLASLAHDLPPSLAWRARGMAEEAADRLNRYFGVVTRANT